MCRYGEIIDFERCWQSGIFSLRLYLHHHLFFSNFTSHCWTFHLFVAEKHPATTHSIKRKYTCRYPKSPWVYRGLSWTFESAHGGLSPVFIGDARDYRGPWAFFVFFLGEPIFAGPCVSPAKGFWNLFKICLLCSMRVKACLITSINFDIRQNAFPLLPLRF